MVKLPVNVSWCATICHDYVRGAIDIFELETELEDLLWRDRLPQRLAMGGLPPRPLNTRPELR